jgi:AmmeMemoRadiSam system protein B
MISSRASLRARAPAVAGSFYPQSVETLSQAVANLLAAADVQERPHRCGVIAPHAGYAYSGLVAAQAFASVSRLHGIERIIVVGPSHFVPFPGIAAPSDVAFSTPLGDMPVDVAAVEGLSEETLVAINVEPHAPEHAIEVELPFLQAIFGDLPIGRCYLGPPRLTLLQRHSPGFGLILCYWSSAATYRISRTTLPLAGMTNGQRQRSRPLTRR